MLLNVRPVSVQEVLLDWGSAEATSPRFRNWDRADVIAKLRNKAPLEEADRAAIVKAIRCVRAPLLDYFFQKPTIWFEADMPVNLLDAIWSDIFFQSDSTLADIASRRPDIKIDGFRLEAMSGRSILVGPSLNGPWILIEGVHRCVEILRMAPAAQPNAIRVLVGVCQSITSWVRWRPSVMV